MFAIQKINYSIAQQKLFISFFQYRYTYSNIICLIKIKQCIIQLQIPAYQIYQINNYIMQYSTPAKSTTSTFIPQSSNRVTQFSPTVPKNVGIQQNLFGLPAQNNILPIDPFHQEQRRISTIAGQSIIQQGGSRVEYRPFQRKVTQYQEIQHKQYVPVKRVLTDFQERKVMEMKPRQIKNVQYCALQTQRMYYKQVIPERTVEMVPVTKKLKRIQMLPLQREIVYMPLHQQAYPAQTIVHKGSEFKEIQSILRGYNNNQNPVNLSPDMHPYQKLYYQNHKQALLIPKPRERTHFVTSQ